MKSSPKITARCLEKLTPLRPTLAMVLGSGFQSVVTRLKVSHTVNYSQLPSFPPVGVSGHQGKLFAGHLGTTPVLVLSGRAHYYEGHDLEDIVFPVRVLAEFGIRDLVLTNAAGGINRRLKPGHFMVFTDHINFMGVNPLRGATAPGKTRFVDLTEAYDPRLRNLLKKAARATDVKLASGVYLAVSGPSYETPAEIEAFARWGADAVGMSTVPEAIVARQCGLAVAGLSCITNPAAGRGSGKLSHEDVLQQSDRVKHASAEMLEKFALLYGQKR